MLLQDEIYLKLIKDYFPCILQKYAEVDDKQLLWELIKMEIRSETMRYCKRKKILSKTRESAIPGRLEELSSSRNGGSSAFLVEPNYDPVSLFVK